VGGQTTFNIGARINGLRNTKIELMPEFYYGVADPDSLVFLGISSTHLKLLILLN
jgi:hypothetical protein